MLLGQQKGRSVEICNSYELLVDKAEDGRFVCDKDYFVAKEDQCKYCKRWIMVTIEFVWAKENAVYNLLWQRIRLMISYL